MRTLVTNDYRDSGTCFRNRNHCIHFLAKNMSISDILPMISSLSTLIQDMGYIYRPTRDMPYVRFLYTCLQPALYESSHDKTKKWHAHPVKTQISLGICPVWSESSLLAWSLGPKLPIERTAKTDQTGRMPRLWSESWLGAKSHCWFCHVVAHICNRWNLQHYISMDLWLPRHWTKTIKYINCFMCANSEGSGETAQMHRLAWTFTGRLCDKYHKLMSWLNYTLYMVWKFYR